MPPSSTCLPPPGFPPQITLSVPCRGTGRDAQFLTALVQVVICSPSPSTISNYVEIDCYVRAFEFFGGCLTLVIPDNWLTAVNRAYRYEPDLNRTYI